MPFQELQLQQKLASNLLVVINQLPSNLLLTKITSKHLDAVDGITCESPGLTSPGGGVYTNRKISPCLCDGEIILRYITYAVLTGDASFLNDCCLNCLKETYSALGIPVGNTIRAVNIMKSCAVAHVSDTNTQAQAGRKFRKMRVTKGDCAASPLKLPAILILQLLQLAKILAVNGSTSKIIEVCFIQEQLRFMKSVLTTVVSAADKGARFPSSSDLESFQVACSV